VAGLDTTGASGNSITGMKCKAPGAQQPEWTSVHEDCEHRATPQFARQLDLAMRRDKAQGARSAGHRNGLQPMRIPSTAQRRDSPGKRIYECARGKKMPGGISHRAGKPFCCHTQRPRSGRKSGMQPPNGNHTYQF